MDMRIGKPLRDIPKSKRTDYGEILAAAKELKRGDWLPVACDSVPAARRIQIACLASRRTTGSPWAGLTVKVRGTVAYVGKASR